MLHAALAHLLFCRTGAAGGHGYGCLDVSAGVLRVRLSHFMRVCVYMVYLFYTELEKKHADNLSILTHLRTELVRISDEVNHAVNVGNAERKEMRSSIQRSSESLRKSDADRKAEGDVCRGHVAVFILLVGTLRVH